MTEKQEFIKMDRQKKVFSGLFKIFELIDNNQIILYLPALDLSAYGETKEKAIEMLNDIMVEYGRNLFTVNQEQVRIEFEKYGWRQNLYFKKKYDNSNSYIDIKGILRNFELPEDTPVKEDFLTV